MNYKSWHWRKRSTEKTIFAMDKVVNPSKITKEEAELEKSSKSLNEKLASVLLDCHTGDNPSTKHSQKFQEEIRVEYLEREADEDLGKEASDESVTPRDATLMQDSYGAVSNISREREKIQKDLEAKLRETNKRLEDLTTENTHLTAALLAKEKSIGDLIKCKHQANAELSTIMARLDSTEKENAFLRYEFHMLEKELEVRKDEIEYSRQYADASHKQYLESLEMASKLEAECQRLHLLLQKRSHCTSGLVRRDTDMRRLKSNPAIGNCPEVSDKSISLMIKRLRDLDEENKALKRILARKNTELENSMFIYAQTASRLSQAEILLRKLSEDHKSTSDDLALLAKFDTTSDEDIISSSGSWANALISELEQLKTGEVRNQKNSKDIGDPGMSMLDDLVEMEKRAIVSVDTPKTGYFSDITGRELVPVEQDLFFSEMKQETQLKYAMFGKSFDWIQIVLNAILEQERISKRSLDELFEDIKIAFDCINDPTACKSDSFDVNSLSGVAEEKKNPHFNPNLRKSIQRIIKLIEGIALKSLEKNQHSEMSQSPTAKEYFVLVFQWKSSDLNPLLHQLVHTCKDLLTGKADFGKFSEEVAFALDWTINNCGTPTHSSSARDKIKKHLSCHQPKNDESFCSLSVTSPDDQCVFFNMKNNQSDLKEENTKSTDELRTTESEKKKLEAMLVSVSEENQDLTKQLQEAKNSIEGLQLEMEALKESRGIIEDQYEKQKIKNEDLDTQLTIANTNLNDIFHKFSSLEFELEDKKKTCEELGATCLQLQLQLESIVKKEPPACGRDEVEKIHQTGWEITAASSKLAECQETILNLGKQLKAIASSSEAALFERVIAINPTHEKNYIKRSSLRTQMQAEYDTKAAILMSPHKDEENETSEHVQKLPLVDQSDNTNSNVPIDPNVMVSAPEKDHTSEKDDRSMSARGGGAIVKREKQGLFGFLKKLLLRKKKGKGKSKRN